MKSSSASSAHCRSSKTSTVGPRSAMRSKNIRQPANRSSLARRRASSSPSRGARRGSMKRRSSSSGTNVRDGRPRASRPRGRRLLLLGDAGAHPHHLGERPEGDALAVGDAAAAVPPDVVDEAVDVLQELPRRAATCRSRRCRHRERGAPCPRRRRVEQVLQRAGTRGRGRRTATRARPSGARRRAARSREAPARAGTGSALPFSRGSPASS